jgi:hypothetical protein
MTVAGILAYLTSLPLRFGSNAAVANDISLQLAGMEHALGTAKIGSEVSNDQTASPIAELVHCLFRNKCVSVPLDWSPEHADYAEIARRVTAALVHEGLHGIHLDPELAIKEIFPAEGFQSPEFSSFLGLIEKLESSLDAGRATHAEAIPVLLMASKDQFLNLENLLRRRLPFKMLPNHGAYERFVKDYFRFCLRYIALQSRAYCIRWEKPAADARVLYNFLNLLLHNAVCKKTIVPSRRDLKAYFIASALHPVVDDWMDGGAEADEINAFEEFLQTGHCRPDAGLPKPMCRLIDDLFALYPAPSFPALRFSLLSLYNWQKVSVQRQRESKLSALLETAFNKGGFAFVFFGSLVTPHLTPLQFSHFFTMGAIFQIMDDLHDVGEDIADGINTPCTQIIAQNGHLDTVFPMVSRLQFFYERLPSPTADYEMANLVEAVEQFGIRYDLIRFSAMNHSRFTNELSESICQQTGVRLSALGAAFNSVAVNESLALYASLFDGRKAHSSIT